MTPRTSPNAHSGATPSDPSAWCCEQHRSALIETIADAWHQADPGWATAPQRRELAGIAVDAIRDALQSDAATNPKNFAPKPSYTHVIHPQDVHKGGK